jgi:hypothetical protein
MLKDRKGAAYWLLVLALATAIAAFVTVCDHFAPAMEGGPKSSIGSTSYTINPYVYLVADQIEAMDDVGGNLNLRLHPYGTYMLFQSPDLLLCGMPMDKFEGVTIPFVVTYRRQASESIKGVGCHELLNASSLSTCK